MRPEPGVARFPLTTTLGLFAAASCVLAWPWLSGAVTIPWDAKSQFHPQLQFMAASFARGEWPFWTPHVFAGWPQIADPQSLIFSPLHVLLAWLDPKPSFRAADAVVFAMLALGGCGVILFFRDRGWHAGGALVAALVFAFGGSSASRIQHIGLILSLAYLPIALWLLARALDRSSWRVGLLAGIAVGLLAVGRDQVALLGLYLLAAYVLAHWLGGAGILARMRASLPSLLACGGVATLIAAIPLLMTALLASASNRPEIDFVTAGRGSLHPGHLLMLVFADIFGAANPTVDYWGPPSFPWGTAFGITDLFHAQNIGQIYAGAIPLVTIVALGLIRGMLWAREIRLFAIATVVTLLFCLGWYTPAFRLMYEVLPGVALFRRPADATFMLGLLFAILAGYLVHRFLTDAMVRTAAWQRIAEAATVGFLVGLALDLAWRIGTMRVALIPIATGLAFAGGAIVTLTVARRLAARHALATVALLAAFTTIDLRWNQGPNESTGLPPATYDALRADTANETVALLKRKVTENAARDRRDRVELAGIGYHWPNLGLTHEFDHVFGHNPLRLRDFARATGVGDTVAVADQRKFAPLFPSYRSTFANLFGLRLIATGVPAEQIDPTLQTGDLTLLARTPDAFVYENPRALPRVVLVQNAQRADFDALLRSGWPADIDPTQTVLLEHLPGGAAGAATTSEAAASGNATSGSARILRYANTEVVVAVDAPSGGFLVLNDAWHPWWRARVDGMPVDILKANVLFRAVAVAPGRHEVRFTFHPVAGAVEELRAKLRTDKF